METRFLVLTLLALLLVVNSPEAAAEQLPDTDWPHYAGSLASSKYSALNQINLQTVGQLQVAWEWESTDADTIRANPGIRPGEFQVTPLAIDGRLYGATALNQVFALDGRTGATLWVYDPGTWREGPATSKGFLHRGVAAWRGSSGLRIYIATGDARLLALDASTGKPITAFGDAGEVDLRTVGLPRPVPRQPSSLYGMTSPPLVVGNLVVVGSYVEDRTRSQEMPRGDVRAFDAETGRLVWTFHTIPLEGEFGVDTQLERQHGYQSLLIVK